MGHHCFTMKYYSLLFAFIFSGISAGYEVKPAMAQSLPQYECQKEVSTEHAKPYDLYFASCTIKEPVDEKTLGSLGEQVYNEMYASEYENIIIRWFLYLKSENDMYLSDIGSTRIKRGTLDKIHIPRVRPRGAPEIATIARDFSVRILTDETTDGMNKEVLDK